MLCESGQLERERGHVPRRRATGKVEVRLTTAARVGEYDRVRVVTGMTTDTTSDVLTGRLF